MRPARLVTVLGVPLLVLGGVSFSTPTRDVGTLRRSEPISVIGPLEESWVQALGAVADLTSYLDGVRAAPARRARPACVKPEPDYGPPGAGNYTGPIPEHVTRRESNGNYRALNCGSRAGGRYQIVGSTWDNVARSMGRLDLVGVAPQDASPEDQDAAAAWLWADGAGCANWSAC